MKKIIGYILLLLSLQNSSLSQTITAEVEYKILSYQCEYCQVSTYTKLLNSILYISDYKNLIEATDEALDRQQLGRNCCCKWNKDNDHSYIESSSPKYEKNTLRVVPKLYKKYNHIEQYGIINNLRRFCMAIDGDFIKWQKYFVEEQAKLEAKELQNQKEAKEQEIKRQEENKRKEFQKNEEFINKHAKTLNDLISDKDFENAALKYTDLYKSGFSISLESSNYRDIIQEGLNSSHNQYFELGTKDLQQIITSNLNGFYQLIKDKTETVEIIFDYNGKGHINDVSTGINLANRLVLKKVGDFDVYAKSKGTFQLTVEQIQNPKKMYFDIWVAPNLIICKSGNKYFEKTFLSASKFREEISVVHNEQVPVGKYWKVRHDLKILKVNGTLINQTELVVLDTEKKLSQRLGMKITRATGSLAILSWLTLRFIEFSSVK